MSAANRPTRGDTLLQRQIKHGAEQMDQRYHAAKGIRTQINKVFPSHWSYLLGELALYSFILLIMSGIYLSLFFDPSMAEVQYHGPYEPLQGVWMSKAFASTLDITFEVRGGLLVRQIHHWGALIFAAAVMVHMFRIFFTGAFRRPREANWVIGAVLLILTLFEGFIGYSLPDDLLSGTGVRVTVSGMVLSVPVIGTWLHWAIFSGAYPGNMIIPRLYAVHILILPGIMAALIAVHLGLVWHQKHTQFPGVRRTERNVVGVRIVPAFALKSGALFAVVTGVTVVMSGLFQINPVWNYGPYIPSMVSAGVQPDWYLAWADGMLRIWPPWNLDLGSYLVPAVFFAGICGMGILFTLLITYPLIERKLSKDTAHHNLIQRPRDAPVRTSLGAMAIALMAVLEASGFNDIISHTFDISLNAMVWAGRIGFLVLPPLAYFVTYRACIGLQRGDREVLEHGIETGIIKRLPHGEFIEIHQPLGDTDEHGHAKPLDYQGAPVPKKPNKLGFAGEPAQGSLLTPDPPEESRALHEARAAQHDGHDGHHGLATSTSEASESPEQRSSGDEHAPSEAGDG